MRIWKGTLSLALVLVLGACGTTPSVPTFPSPLTPGAYPSSLVAVSPGYPAPIGTAPNYSYPGPVATAPTPTAPAERATVTSSVAARVFVTYKDFEIAPKQITITVGTTVTFLIESASGAHHRPYNDTPPNVFEALTDLSNGASFSYTFTEPGKVTIRCRDHDTLTATITVTP